MGIYREVYRCYRGPGDKYKTYFHLQFDLIMMFVDLLDAKETSSTRMKEYE